MHCLKSEEITKFKTQRPGNDDTLSIVQPIVEWVGFEGEIPKVSLENIFALISESLDKKSGTIKLSDYEVQWNGISTLPSQFSKSKQEESKQATPTVEKGHNLPELDANKIMLNCPGASHADVILVATRSQWAGEGPNQIKIGLQFKNYADLSLGVDEVYNEACKVLRKEVLAGHVEDSLSKVKKSSKAVKSCKEVAVAEDEVEEGKPGIMQECQEEAAEPHHLDILIVIHPNGNDIVNEWTVGDGKQNPPGLMAGSKATLAQKKYQLNKWFDSGKLVISNGCDFLSVAWRSQSLLSALKQPSAPKSMTDQSQPSGIRNSNTKDTSSTNKQDSE